MGAVRDHVLLLACLSDRVPPAQARGYDDLSAETLAGLEEAHVGGLEPGGAPSGARSVLALVHEGTGAHLPHAYVVAERLAELR